jgi:phosphoglucomutase
MATAYRNQGKNIYQRLLELQESLGIFVTNNSYYISRDPAVTSAIFEDFRNDGKYKTALGVHKIASFKDITKGVNSDLPETPDAQMIQLIFTNGANVTLRASGTEPKIKYYSELAYSCKIHTVHILLK